MFPHFEQIFTFLLFTINFVFFFLKGPANYISFRVQKTPNHSDSVITTARKIAKTWPLTSRVSQVTGPASYTNQQLHRVSPGSSGSLPHFQPSTHSACFSIQIWIFRNSQTLLSRCFHPSLPPLTPEAFSGPSSLHPSLRTHPTSCVKHFCPLHCARLSCVCPLGFAFQTYRDVLKLFF